MSLAVSMLTLPTISFAFNTVQKPNIKSFKYVGDISPTGYFDPLNILKKITQNILEKRNYNMVELL